MDWAFNWSFVATAATGILGIIFGIAILARGRSRDATVLGALVLVEGINFAADGASYLYLGLRDDAFGLLTDIGLITARALAVLYLVFLRVGLVTRTTRPLQGPLGLIIIGLFGAWAVATSTFYVVGGSGALSLLGPVWVHRVVQLIPFAWALVAAVGARLEATEADDQRRANAFLAAFAMHDLAWVFLSLTTAAAISNGVPVEQIVPASYVGWAIVGAIFFPGVAYAAFHGLLRDVDRTFRIGLTNTAAAGMIAALFVVGTELIESLFDFDNQWISVGIAVVLAFGFQPVQNIAQRGAYRLFPSPAVSPLDYREAIEQALADGNISAREQRMLDELRSRMRA